MTVSDSIWVTSIVNRGRNFVDYPVVAAFFTLGWIPLIASLIVLFFGSPTRFFIIAQILTASIVVFGPYQAYKYDQEVLPNFFKDVTEIIAKEDHNQIEQIRDRSLRLFRDEHTPFVIFWTFMVMSVLLLNSSYFADQGIVPNSPLYWIYLIFLIHFGLLSGLGLFSVIVTAYSIRAVSSLHLQIEPLHPDGLGGLSIIGEFAIWTTILISNGALAIPLSLSMITSYTGGIVVYSGIGVYILLIALSFVYPTAKVNRHAQKLREKHLENYRSKIRSLEHELSQPENDKITNQDLALQMEIDRVRKEFRDYQNVRLYPLSIGIFSRLVSSVLLPLILIFFEYVLTTYIAS